MGRTRPGRTRRPLDAAPVRRRVPFLGHTVAEYVVAAALIAVGLHTTGAAAVVLVASGAALAVLNACTRGPLGAIRLLGRRAHHAGDLLIIAVLALSPLLALRDLHLAGVIVAEVVALVLLRIEHTTRYLDPVPVRPSPAAPSAAAPPSAAAQPSAAPSVPPAAPAAPATPAAAATAAAAQSVGAAAARVTGGGRRVALSSARRLGLVAGVTRRVLREQRAAARPEPPGRATTSELASRERQ